MNIKNILAVPEKLDFLLIIRGLAALSVIYWHLGGYLVRADYFYSYIVIPGRLAVWIFFMMSGYLIGHALLYGKYTPTIKGIVRFYNNRLLRIYPIFFTVSVVGLLFGYSTIELHFDFILKEIFMIQWNHNYTLNSVYWTLGVETQFYVLAPLIIFSFIRIFPNLRNVFYFIFFCSAVFGFIRKVNIL